MAGDIQDSDNYGDKLAKLLPAEGIAALLAIKNIVPDVQSDDKIIEGSILAIAIFVGLWAYRIRRITNWVQITFLLIAYTIWAMTIFSDRLTANFEGYEDTLAKAIAALAVLCTTFAPLLFPTKGAR